MNMNTVPPTPSEVAAALDAHIGIPDLQVIIVDYARSPPPPPHPSPRRRDWCEIVRFTFCLLAMLSDIAVTILLAHRKQWVQIVLMAMGLFCAIAGMFFGSKEYVAHS